MVIPDSKISKSQLALPVSAVTVFNYSTVASNTRKRMYDVCILLHALILLRFLDTLLTIGLSRLGKDQSNDPFSLS